MSQRGDSHDETAEDLMERMERAHMATRADLARAHETIDELRAEVARLTEARDELDRIVDTRGKRLDRLHNERAIKGHLLRDLLEWAAVVDDHEARRSLETRVLRRLHALRQEGEQ